MIRFKQFYETDLEEAIKLGSRVKIHDPGQHHHGQIGHVGEIRHGLFKGAPKKYTVDYGERQSIQLDKKNIKTHKESVEESKDFSKYIMKATKTEPKIVRKTNPAGRTTDHVEYEVHGTLSSHKRTFKSKKEAEAYFNTVKEEVIDEGAGGSESWEAGYKRRVVKTTSAEHKEKGHNWRIKGKERPEISIKLYKEKPSQAEFNKQMRRVAGHEFGG
jgi:hypothetical protein